MVKRLDFMILGLPRSGTTWAANWLTTDQSICWHDPVTRALPSEVDQWPSEKPYRGISCTGAWMWLPWINAHPARKVILERDPRDVNESLLEMGLPPMTQEAISAFGKVEGMRLPFDALWKAPEDVWHYLLPELPFDEQRHAELSGMLIQPVAEAIIPDPAYLKKAIENLRSELWL